jgi:DNA-binding SARP family transcriptional activator/DNA-binding beta-propeller fold protein YncE
VELLMLGSFDVVVNGRSVQLGGAKQRALLAILALHANEVVPADRLIGELWPGDAPESAVNTLQGYVSRLRKVLDLNGSNGGQSIIAFRAPGYVLTLPPEQIDARRFERIVGEAEARAAIGDAPGAAASFAEALRLWRGAPLADFTYEEFAQPEIARLEELRLKVVEERIDADLACGRHATLVPELEALVAEHPLRERLRGQLMLALYRSGRQGEALAVYRDARRLMHDELGLEPMRALSELERSILQQDPALDLPAAPRLLARGRGGRRRLVAGAAGAFTAAAALGAIVLWPQGDAASTVPVANNSVAVVDPRTDRVVDDIVTGDYPGPLASDGRYVWVGNTGNDTIMAIDAKTRTPGFATAVQQPLDFAVTGNRLWIANGTSFASGRPSGGGTIQCRGCRPGTTMTLELGPRDRENSSPATVGSDGPFLWAAAAASRTVYRVNPESGRILNAISGVDGSAIAVADGAAWVAEPRRGDIVRIDASGRGVARIRVPGDPMRVAADATTVWVAIPHPQGAVWRARSAVWRIDAKTRKPVAVISVPASARRVATGAGYVWVTSGTYQGEPGVPSGGGVLSKIDPRTNRVVSTIKIGFRPDGVVVANGLVWVAVAPR